MLLLLTICSSQIGSIIMAEAGLARKQIAAGAGAEAHVHLVKIEDGVWDREETVP